MQNHRHVQFFAIALLLSLFVISAGHVPVNAQTTPDPDEVEQGAQLYAENCAVCHGKNGEGRIGATLDKNWPSIRPDATIRSTISQGIPGSTMGAFAQTAGGPFNTAEIDAIVTYILSWGTVGFPDAASFPSPTSRPPISPVPEVVGDPNRGAVLYDENCAMCHGPNGEGRIGARLAENWPSIRPDLTVRATISQGIPGTTMQAFSQANGGPLTEQDIDDITAFVMTLPSTESVEATTEPTTTSPFSGFTGVLVAILLFILIIAIVLLVQRWRGNNEKSR